MPPRNASTSTPGGRCGCKPTRATAGQPPCAARPQAQSTPLSRRQQGASAAADRLLRRSLSVCASAASGSAQAPRPPQRRQSGDWDELRRLQKEGEAVTITLDTMTRTGGKFTLAGVQGFIPYNAMDFKHLGGALEGVALDFLAGKQLTMKLLTVDEGEGRLIGSEMAFLRQQMAAQLQAGEIVEGVVSRCTDYGAYVQLGAGKSLQAVEGLVHISELSWNRIFTPEAVVRPGDVVRCCVVGTDPAQGKINLSLKRMEPDPLSERMDTVMPPADEASGAVGTVAAEIPSSIEDILRGLKAQPGIDDAVLGRQAEEKRTISQDLEVWLATTEVADGFALIARAGRLLQEIRVTTRLSKEQLRAATAAVLKQLSKR